MATSYASHNAELFNWSSIDACNVFSHDIFNNIENIYAW